MLPLGKVRNHLTSWSRLRLRVTRLCENKNLYKFKEYDLWRILTELLKINCKTEGLGSGHFDKVTLMIKFGKQEALTIGMRVVHCNVHITEETMATVVKC